MKNAGLAWGGAILSLVGFIGFAATSVWAISLRGPISAIPWYVWTVWAITLALYLVGFALLIYYMFGESESEKASRAAADQEEEQDE